MPPGADAVAQARALLQQLRALAAQHDQVLSTYESQLDAMVAAGPSKLSAKAPNKRPLLSEPEGPEAKKQRLVAEQHQRRNALWHECYKVLDRCRRNQKAEAFKKPVDPIRMKIPDYPLLVKNPMDLQTVGEKLKLRVYKDPAEFAADMRLIWDNAVIYNGRTHVVGLAAQAMSEFFEKAWGPLQVDKQWGIMLKQEDLAREVGGRGWVLGSAPSGAGLDAAGEAEQGRGGSRGRAWRFEPEQVAAASRCCCASLFDRAAGPCLNSSYRPSRPNTVLPC